MRLYNMSISLLGKIQKDVLPLKIYRNWKITLKIFRNRKNTSVTLQKPIRANYRSMIIKAQ
jgi:hypothetical protein